MGNYSVNQNSLTVTAPVIVPVDKILEGVTIAGQTGTMPNMATTNPNGAGVGRSQAKEYWTGGGSTVFLKPQKGYYDGSDTWAFLNEPNLISNNIRAGSSIFGVNGNFTADATATAGQIASGATAYVNGNKITGTMKTPKITGGLNLTIYQGPSATYLTGTDMVMDSYTFGAVSGIASVAFSFYSNSSSGFIYWDLKVNGISSDKSSYFGYGTFTRNTAVNVTPGTVVELWGYTSSGFNGYKTMGPMKITIGTVSF